MALLINKNLNLFGSLDVSTLYVRFRLDYVPAGTEVYTHADTYVSREAYDDSAAQNTLNVDGIPQVLVLSYDRAVDGTDVLVVVHDKYKDFLSTDIIEDLPVLDPSTGEPTYDPSTGEPITEPVITVPKFAQDSSIQIVDVSIA